jgi:hypothetical protein
MHDIHYFASLVPIVLIFGMCIFFMWYLIRNIKLKERILLAEKGINFNNLNSKENVRNNWCLKIGIVLICASLGLLLFLYIETLNLFPQHLNDSLSVIAPFLFSGIGMVIAHYADRPRPEK